MSTVTNRADDDAPRRPGRPSLGLALLALASGCRTSSPVLPAPPEPGYERGHPGEVPRGEEPSAAPVPPPPRDLEDCLRLALQSPAVSEALALEAAARRQSSIVGSWPDPRLTARYFVEEVETRVGPQEAALGLAQRLPWPGLLGARTAVADAKAEARSEGVRAARARIRAAVQELWYDLYLLDRRVELVVRSRDLLSHLEEVVRTRYASGETDYSALLRIQVELGRLEDRLARARDERHPVAARLNALLSRPPDAELPQATLGESQPPPPPATELVARVRATNPRLGELTHELAAADRALAAADLSNKPEITLGVEYVLTGEARMPGVAGSGDDPVAATLSLELPLARASRRARSRAARDDRLAAQARLRTESDRLAAEVEAVLFQWRDAERRLELYLNTLLPRVRQSLEATETAFRSGDASFSDLLDIERSQLELELEYERARTDQARAGARLEELLGETPSPGTSGS